MVSVIGGRLDGAGVVLFAGGGTTPVLWGSGGTTLEYWEGTIVVLVEGAGVGVELKWSQPPLQLVTVATLVVQVVTTPVPWVYVTGQVVSVVYVVIVAVLSAGAVVRGTEGCDITDKSSSGFLHFDAMEIRPGQQVSGIHPCPGRQFSEEPYSGTQELPVPEGATEEWVEETAPVLEGAVAEKRDEEGADDD